MALSSSNPFYDLVSDQKKESQNPFQDLIDQHSAKNIDPNVLKRIVPSLGNVGSDILSGIKSIPKAATDIWGALPEIGEAAKRQIPGAYEQMTEEPGRAGRNIIGGFAKTAGGIAQIPPAMVDYMAKIGLIEPETASKFARPTSMQDINTAVGQFVGGEEKPGDVLLQGAIPSLYGTGKLLSPINPLQLTQKNIIKNVLSKETLQKGIHTKLYDDLWKQAEKKGFKEVPYNPDLKDVEAIKKYTTEKYHGSLNKYINDRSLPNAQKAQSDLGRIKREYEKKPSLTSEEKATYDAAVKVQGKIKDNMFKNKQGVIDNKLLRRYNNITESYGKNVIPYTTNKYIKEYKGKDITEEQLLRGLSKGRFAARKGKEHRAIAIRNALSKKYTPFAVGALLGTSGLSILNKLLGKENNTEESK